MFELLNQIIANGKELYIVKTKGGVSIMEESEYRRVWGNYHPERWRKLCTIH